MSDLVRSVLRDGRFWTGLDGRIGAAVRRVGKPLRGVLRGVRLGQRVPTAVAGLRDGEDLDDVELGQDYGVASIPPDGTEVVAVAIGGAGHHRVAVTALDRSKERPTDLVAGDVVIYSSNGKASVRVQADGQVIIQGGPLANITIDADGASVLLNGTVASPGVGRVGDAITPTAGFVSWLNGLALRAGYTPPWGSIAHIGNISTGSSNVKAGG